MKQALCCAYGLQSLVSIAEDDYDVECGEFDHPALTLLGAIVVDEWPPIGERVLRKEIIPTVFHGSWLAPSGRTGHVLVNWSGGAEEAVLGVEADEGAIRVTGAPWSPRGKGIALSVPARSVALVEV